ncbi:MAG: carotenoid biosynthesis protein, partial [Saprospiraceae bacterium]
AIIYGFWSWGVDNIIPTQNYVAWFLISFFLLGIFNLLFKKLRNNAAFTLFILQFVFFLLLGIQW